MEMAHISTELKMPHFEGGNGHGDPQAQVNSALYQAAYEAGYARAHEAGYRLGYKEGFAEGFKSAGGATAVSMKSESGKGTDAHDGQRLLGLPCVKCGKIFYSDETHCPRCKTARPGRSRV